MLKHPEEDKITILEGYVVEAKAHVEQQIKIVEQLRRDEAPTDEAETLLAAYEGTLATHQTQLDIAREEARLRSKLNPPTT